jgi:hypothetical protein
MRTGEAPRDGLDPNQGWVELGAWHIKRLRQRPHIHLYPWSTPPASVSDPEEQASVNRDPLALARFYQSLLDSHVVENRAALARYLGVSRSRVTQVLRRLDRTRKSDGGGRPTANSGKEAGHAD